MNAVLDATIPEQTLPSETEKDIEAAANLIKCGVDPVLVLRVLYSLGRMNGMNEMARLG